MKCEIENKNSKLYVSWENLNADFYKIFLKMDETFYECANVKDSNFTTISMLPLGENKIYIQAIKNGEIIGKTPVITFKNEKFDAVSFKSENKTHFACTKHPLSDGYRLYKSHDNDIFNGSKNFINNNFSVNSEQNVLYKIKPYKLAGSERVNLASSAPIFPNKYFFKYLTLYKSYSQKAYLSWIFNGNADGFYVYTNYSNYPVFETNDGLCHFAYLEGFKDDVEFIVKAFINTPNGKVIILTSEAVKLSYRKFEHPEVSVIIPAYNAFNYIARSIDSALASNFNDLEIIIVNDGSSDETQKVIDWYKEQYSNIISIQKENGGVASARNVGIEAANGKYIAFLDNDDMLRPDMINTLYNSIVKNNCDIAIAPLYRLVDKGYTLHCNLPFEQNKAIDVDEYFKIMYTPGYYNCAIWNKLYKASLVKAHPLGILRYEDVSWTPCILSWAKNFCFVKIPLYDWDRKTRPQTFGDVLSQKPEDELLEHRKQAMWFFIQNGNPKRIEALKEVAKRRLLRYGKNATHNGYNDLIEKINNNDIT